MVKKVVEGVNGLRERKKARTRQTILEASLDLFERKGYDSTTIEEIAEAADISPRTFFRYFESKLDLVMVDKDFESAEEQDDHEGAFASWLLEAGEGEEGLVDTIRNRIVEQFDERVAGDPCNVRRVRLMLETPSLRAITREHFDEHLPELTRAFAEALGVDEDDLQAHLFAAGVGTTLWTVIERWAAERGSRERLAEMLDEGFALLRDGLDSQSAPRRRGARAKR
jgi:AcrR family transcriptional regulator